MELVSGENEKLAEGYYNPLLTERLRRSHHWGPAVDHSLSPTRSRLSATRGSFQIR